MKKHWRKESRYADMMGDWCDGVAVMGSPMVDEMKFEANRGQWMD